MHPSPPDELTDWSADELSRRLHRRQVSCREVMAAYLARIEWLNPHCKAIVNLAPTDELLRQADARDAELARGRSRGWMHGMPQAIKDTGHALGFPTTFGCTLLRDATAPARRPDGGAHEGGRLHRHRQDQYARAGPGLTHVQ